MSYNKTANQSTEKDHQKVRRPQKRLSRLSHCSAFKDNLMHQREPFSGKADTRQHKKLKKRRSAVPTVAGSFLDEESFKELDEVPSELGLCSVHPQQRVERHSFYSLVKLGKNSKNKKKFNFESFMGGNDYDYDIMVTKVDSEAITKEKSRRKRRMLSHCDFKDGDSLFCCSSVQLSRKASQSRLSHPDVLNCPTGFKIN